MYAWYFTAEANVGLRDWNIGKDMIETAKRAVKYGPDLSDANSLLATLMAKILRNSLNIQKKNCLKLLENMRLNHQI